jgi:hypothetical protein
LTPQIWVPWSVWFVVLLLSAVWVPIYALDQTIQAGLQSRAKRETQARCDLAPLCQQGNLGG